MITINRLLNGQITITMSAADARNLHTVCGAIEGPLDHPIRLTANDIYTRMPLVAQSDTIDHQHNIARNMLVTLPAYGKRNKPNG